MRHVYQKKNWDSVSQEEGEIDYYYCIFIFANLVGENSSLLFWLRVYSLLYKFCCGISVLYGSYLLVCELLRDYEFLKGRESVILIFASSVLCKCQLNKWLNERINE